MRKAPFSLLFAVIAAAASAGVKIPFLANLPGLRFEPQIRGGSGHGKSDLFLNRTRSLGVKWRP